MRTERAGAELAAFVSRIWRHYSFDRHVPRVTLLPESSLLLLLFTGGVRALQTSQGDRQESRFSSRESRACTAEKLPLFFLVFDVLTWVREGLRGLALRMCRPRRLAAAAAAAESAQTHRHTHRERLVMK